MTDNGMTNDDGALPDASTLVRKAVPRPFHVAVVGASGVVGRETLSILAERDFPVASIKALASERSAGETVAFGDEELTIEALTPDAFDGVELAFFAAGGGVSREMTKVAAEKGAVCIDKSSVFRMDDDVPLVVPEVNGEALAGYGQRRLIATPNCSTIQLVQVLKPLHDAAGLKRVVCSTYQAVSGAGKDGVDELETQVRDLFNLRELSKKEVFGGHRIAFNVLPCIPGSDAFLDDGATQEEQKMIDESRKILKLPDLRIAVTCARVPVFNGHAEAVNVELERALSPDDARDLLGKTPNVMVIDDPSKHLYPTPEDATGEDQTLVGRIRTDSSVEHGLSLWIVSDNLRTGAALNAVRIAESLCAEHLS
jgi:aspartate-semialdehyde dehydrogenase